MVTTQKMIAALDRQMTLANSEVSALERLQRGIAQDLARIDGELDAAWQRLTETVLPSLDPAVLDRAAALLRLAPLQSATVEQQLRGIIASAQQRYARVVNDPSYVNRETIINEASIRTAEVEEALRPLVESTSSLEQEPYFSELLQYRYGTDEYAVRFWQLSYYTHWKHAELIIEKHGQRMKSTDFAGIAARYVDEKNAQRSLESVRQSQRDKLRAVDAAVAAVNDADDAAKNAVPRMLASLRGRVREHLAPLDVKDVAALVVGAGDIDLAWRRVVGLKKKQEYLTALSREQLRGPLNDINALRSKLQRDRAKLARPKNLHRQWSQHDYDRRFGVDRSGKWSKRRDRIEDARTHIVRYEAYDRWDPYSDILWWDLMTDGRIDGNFIDEVRERPTQYVFQSQQHAAAIDVDDRNDSFADVS